MRLPALAVFALFAVHPAVGEKQFWNDGSILQTKEEEQEHMWLKKKSGKEQRISKWAKRGHDAHQITTPVKPEWVKPSDYRPASGRTFSEAGNNMRGLRGQGEHRGSPQQGDPPNRRRLILKWGCGKADRTCCSWFHKERCDAGLTCVKPRPWVISTCEPCGDVGAHCCATRDEDGICKDPLTCNKNGYCECIPNCTKLQNNTRDGLQEAIDDMVAAGDTMLTLCPNTVVTWGEVRPSGNHRPLTNVPKTFKLGCDLCADATGCVLDGGGSSKFFETTLAKSDWTFRGITFHHGYSPWRAGGAIQFAGQGSNLTIM